MYTHARRWEPTRTCTVRTMHAYDKVCSVDTQSGTRCRQNGAGWALKQGQTLRKWGRDEVGGSWGQGMGNAGMGSRHWRPHSILPDEGTAPGTGGLFLLPTGRGYASQLFLPQEHWRRGKPDLHSGVHCCLSCLPLPTLPLSGVRYILPSHHKMTCIVTALLTHPREGVDGDNMCSNGASPLEHSCSSPSLVS